MAIKISTAELNFKDDTGTYQSLAGYNDGRPTDIAERIYNGIKSRASTEGYTPLSADEVTGMIGHPYSSTATYSVGDYVYNETDTGSSIYKLYRCIQAVTNPGQNGTSDTDYWVEVPLADEVSGLKSDLVNVQNDIYGVINQYNMYTYTSGRFNVSEGSNFGKEVADTAYVRTSDFIHAAANSTISVDDTTNYRFQVCCYYENDINTCFKVKSATINDAFMVPRDCWIRIACGPRSGNASISSTPQHLVLNIINIDDGIGKLKEETRYQLKLQDLNFTIAQITATGNIDTSITSFASTPDFVYCLKNSVINVKNANYVFNVAYYSDADVSTFIDFKSVSAIRPFIMPIDGYVRFGIRTEPSTTLTDCSIINNLDLNLIQPIKNKVEFLEANNIHTFDPSTIHWVNKQLSGARGGLNDSTTYVATEDFIFANAGSTISVDEPSAFSFNVGLYHEPNLNEGSFFGFKSASDASYTVPADCYIRASIKYSTTTELEDTSISSHLVFNIQQPTEKFVETIANKYFAKGESSPYYKKLDFGICYLQDYYYPFGENSDFEEFPDANIDSNNKINDYTAQAFYTKFDALVNDYSPYVTTIGSFPSTTSSGTKDNTNVLKWYSFNPIPNYSAKFEYKPVKIIIVSGQHGYEKATPLGMYYFVRDLLTKWDKHPALNYIRNHVQLLICPLANPYGFNHNQRRNARNVDLNRNYNNATFGFVSTIQTDTITNLDTSESYYWMGGTYTGPDGKTWETGHLIQYDGSKWATKGASPSSGSAAESEYETQAICSVLRENTDALIVIDWHNFGNNPIEASKVSNFNWHSYAPELFSDSFFNKALDASKYHFTELTNQMKIRYPNLYNNATINPNNTLRLGTISNVERTACLLKNYAMDLNMLGMTFETMNGHVNYANGPASRDTQKINTELIGNWLKNLLSIYAK